MALSFPRTINQRAKLTRVLETTALKACHCRLFKTGTGLDKKAMFYQGLFI